MQVILLEDMRGIGRRGEVVRVKPGFARNYLIPQGRGLTATPANLKYYEEQKKRIDLPPRATPETKPPREPRKSPAPRSQIAKRVGSAETLYGSVHGGGYRRGARAKGITVDKRRLDLGGGIKTLGDHVVQFDLHAEVVAEIQVTVVAEE